MSWWPVPEPAAPREVVGDSEAGIPGIGGSDVRMDRGVEEGMLGIGVV